MRSERITFENGRGERLTGQIERPASSEPPIAWAVFAHCFTCTRNLRAARVITRALAARGYGVLRFDFTGLGESEGEFADTNFSSNVDDLLAAVAWLSAREAFPALLIGHSLGGAAILKAADELPDVRAVATIAAPYDPAHVTRLLGASRAEIDAAGEAEVQLAGRPFRIKRQLVDDLEREGPPAQRIARLRKALLVMHAPHDDTVSIENATQIFVNAKHPKSFVSLDDADHLLSREADAEYAAHVLGAWAERFVGERALRPEAVHRAESASAAGLVDDAFDVVAVTGQGYRTELAAGEHRFLADEPAGVGGTNAGPTPYELLSAALAACTSMTLRMYADRRQLPLEQVAVKVRHEKVHAKDCEDCEARGGRIDVFHRQISLQGPLDDAARRRLLEIADRCPVHRTLEGEVRIRTDAAPPA